MKLPVFRLFCALACAAVGAPAIAADAPLPRYPQASRGQIIFVAGGDVWSVARTGGAARRLAALPGQAMFPRASPDGRWIAFTQTTNIASDIWIVPAAGGPARKLDTFPSVAGVPTGAVGRRSPPAPLEGGQPQALPVDDAVGLASFGPDGHTIAYNRDLYNFWSWKRYDGGLAPQVFAYNLVTRHLDKITDWSGYNTSPMLYKIPCIIFQIRMGNVALKFGHMI